MDLNAAIDKLIRAGLDVAAGFIMGFDSDDAGALDRQREWILRSRIPQAMIGILSALPGTELERRLAREGRLIEHSSGETFGRANFRTTVKESVLLGTYRATLEEIYRPESYFARCLRALKMRPHADARLSLPWHYAIRCLIRSVWHQGITGRYRKAYWRFLTSVLRRAPRRLARAVALAIAGEHMIRYTSEVVLPRLTAAIEEVHLEEAARQASSTNGRPGGESLQLPEPARRARIAV